jgi:hypothetical protein
VEKRRKANSFVLPRSVSLRQRPFSGARQRLAKVSLANPGKKIINPVANPPGKGKKSATFEVLHGQRRTMHMIQTERRHMNYLFAALIAVASLLSPLASFAQSADVEATITKVDTSGLTLTLDDGKTYQVPSEFDFDGLAAGVKVTVFYTVVDGKRVVDDLEIEQ